RLKEIGAALRDPIRQLGLLTDFAADRLRLAVRRGEPDVGHEVDPRLERHFEYLEKHTRELRAAAERAIARHGKAIVERQFVGARLADMAIELYVRGFLLSRTEALLEAVASGAVEAPARTRTPQPLGPASLERRLRVCDLAAQRSGLR